MHLHLQVHGAAEAALSAATAIARAWLGAGCPEPAELAQEQPRQQLHGRPHLPQHCSHLGQWRYSRLLQGSPQEHVCIQNQSQALRVDDATTGFDSQVSLDLTSLSP